MTLSFTNPDQWHEKYETASQKLRYEIIMKTMEQPLSEKFIEELDIGEYLLELKDILISNNLIEQAITFINSFQAKQPELYKEEFQYFDNLLIDYYLYRNEPEKVTEALSRFMENPVQGIDQMKVILDILLFYGNTDLTVKLSRKTYEPIKISSEIIAGAEIDLGNIVFINLIEKIYLQIQSGKTVNWQKFTTQAAKYDFIHR